VPPPRSPAVGRDAPDPEDDWLVIDPEDDAESDDDAR
jgi:hypothetical protein